MAVPDVSCLGWESRRSAFDPAFVSPRLLHAALRDEPSTDASSGDALGDELRSEPSERSSGWVESRAEGGGRGRWGGGGVPVGAPCSFTALSWSRTKPYKDLRVTPPYEGPAPT